MFGGAGREVQLGAYWRARQRHCRAGARGSLQGFGRGLASPNPHRPASRPYEYHSKLTLDAMQTYMCATLKAAGGKISGEPSARAGRPCRAGAIAQ